MRIGVFVLYVFLVACSVSNQDNNAIYVSGETNSDEEYLTIGDDTITVVNGLFSDTIIRNEDQYNYLKLSSWKWPKIVYLKKSENLSINFRNENIETGTDRLNQFLLNKDSILTRYSARWDMSNQDFNDAWQKELPLNFLKIDSYFKQSDTPEFLIDELKQMEYMRKGHLTANFISFRKRKDLDVDSNIYDFVSEIDLNNERLGFHQSNRNFQYFYYFGKLGDEVPDSIYPFAVIDTAVKYVKIDGIRDMIIRSAVNSGFYMEEVDSDALLKAYRQNISEDSGEEELLKIYNQIQKLKPGNSAPDIGLLESISGDSISMKDLIGKNILISTWGTWCPFCKEQLPHLKRLMNSYQDKFVSVAISLDSETEVWKNYVNENQWSGMHLIDRKRGSTFRKNYLISGTNKYYLIDKKGTIVSGKLKPSSKELEALIMNLD